LGGSFSLTVYEHTGRHAWPDNVASLPTCGCRVYAVRPVQRKGRNRRTRVVDQDTARGLIAGAYDMHVHSGPDVMPRKFDDVLLAERVRDSGMAGFVIKSHYVCTADRAALIRQLYPDVHAYGGVVLNNAVGG